VEGKCGRASERQYRGKGKTAYITEQINVQTLETELEEAIMMTYKSLLIFNLQSPCS
jgi:hypothetical protein